MPSNAQWAITLPNQFAPIGEVLSQGNAIQARQNSQLADIYKEKLKQQDQDTNANLDELKRQTGEVEKTKTINEGINATTHNAINDIYSKYSQAAKSMKPSDYSASLMNDLAQLSNWHQAATTAGDRMLQEHQALLKQNPSLDASKLLDTGANNFANRFIDPNTKQLIPPERINQNQSFFSNLQNPDEVAAHTATTEGIPKFFKDLDKSTFNDKSEVNKKGFIEKRNYKGYNLGDLQQKEYDSHGELIANPLKFETSDIKDANGKPLRMITPTLEKTMRANGLGGQMDKLWLDNKEPEIINWALQNHKSPKDLTPEVLDQLKKSFLYKNFSQYVPSQVSPDELTATPRDRINIYTGQGDSNINNVYKSISDRVNTAHERGYDALAVNTLNTDAQNTIIDFVRKTTGGEKYNYSNLVIAKNPDGQIGIYKTAPQESGDNVVQKAVIKDENLIGILPEIGTNLKAQPGVAEKRQVIQHGNKDIKPLTEKTYNANGKNYTHNELLKLGYTEDQINQAIKLGNLK